MKHTMKIQVALCFALAVLCAHAQGDSSEIHKIVEQSMGQATANITKVLKEYEEAKDPTSKFLMASLVMEITQEGTFKEYPSIGEQLGEKDKKQIASVIKEYKATMDKVKQFESSLSKEDVEKIVQDNPQSVFKRIGKYSSTNDLGACTKDDFASARLSVDPQKKFENYPEISLVANLYDSAYVNEYHQRARELLTGDQRFSKFRSLADSYYFDIEKTGQSKKEFVDELKKNIEALEKKIKDRNKSIPDVKSYALDAVAKYPHCLVGLNMDFWSMWNREVTVERGKALLLKLKKEKNLSCDNAAVYLASSKDLHVDAWGLKYYFKSNDKSCEMFSSGEDRKISQDDILVSSF